MNRIYTSAVVSVMALALTGPGVAVADEANDAALCAQADHPCSIRVAPVLREAASYPVTVAGATNTSTTVQTYRVLLDGDRISALEPYGDAVPVKLNAAGIAQASVVMPKLSTNEAGGYVLVGLAGARGVDVSSMVGSFAVLGASRPTLLGDGYGDQKPVGQVLDLQYYGALSSARYTVDMQDDSDGWSEVSAPEQPGDVAASPDAVGHLRYALPRGLPSRQYSFRLRNTALGEVVANWHATPSLSPVMQPRSVMWTPPPVGNKIGNSATRHAHRTAPTKLAATGIIGICAAVSVIPGMRAARRRRHLARVARPRPATSPIDAMRSTKVEDAQ
ncbi:hypothetical protein LJ112_10455 [Propionibacterium freudenreichii]|uniref:hypothetical protein n=1 Tax=Propionibacterium freudenreichii TaxID=1744 RepID=UPI0005442355|nr:hypothetical protein [Propionibacterium freudenreichii]MDK9300082.1 hypothetical protein [Propionibacterium freudenreichii]MDK9319122.1 hypothetical protein [Propionibacterium freudenreichii]WBF59541.1 hypothetical protein LJ113_10460 [Propionibacterium freudenreichii]WBF63872.1 hypothetical protein LJ112_10455 [Propionibacterium freudenreichii]CEH05708.1 Putative uncharacterized protein [Propionibacterium freudenreichii]